MSSSASCPFCRSSDVRLLARVDELTAYRCHDCARTFHLTDRSEETTRQTPARPASLPMSEADAKEPA